MLPQHDWWAIHVAILIGVYMAVALAGVKAFWLWRIYRLVRHVHGGTGPAGASDQNISSAQVTSGDQLVTTFQVIRKVTKPAG